MNNSERAEWSSHLDDTAEEVPESVESARDGRLRGKIQTSAFFSTIVVNGKESSGFSVHRTVQLNLDTDTSMVSSQSRKPRVLQSDTPVEKKRGRAASQPPESGETRSTKRSQSHPPNLHGSQSNSSSDVISKRIRPTITEEPEVQTAKRSGARKGQQPLQTPDVIEMHPPTPLVSLPTPKASLVEVNPGSSSVISATQPLPMSPTQGLLQNAAKHTRRHPFAFVAAAVVAGGVIGWLVYSGTDRDRTEVTSPDTVLTMIEPVASTSQPHSPLPTFTRANPRQRLTSALPPPRSADLRALLATPRDETSRAASLKDIGVVLFLRRENQMQAERLREQQVVIDRLIRNAQATKEDDEPSFHSPFNPPIRPTASSIDRLHASDVSSGELPFVRSSVHELRSTQSSAANSPLTMSVTSAELEASMIGAGVQIDDERTTMAGLRYEDEGGAAATGDEWDHVSALSG
ncbi:hypothetical protein BJ742DRAFT_840734 [Cladochytrium replicatum]|nr:hypothetical protein BJ742DRAFT_840734 [Cladochytrium replicatum]